MSAEFKITYTLEMNHPDEFRPKRVDLPDLRVERMEIPCPEFNSFLHTVVGHDYRWGGRIGWGQEEWNAYVRRPGFETWVAYWTGTPAGYFELEMNTQDEVHLLSFGLLPQFIGEGLGGYLLTRAVARAWEMGARRIWVSTCSHDHPHALKNYLARGFRVRQVVEGPANPPIKSFWELAQADP